MYEYFFGHGTLSIAFLVLYAVEFNSIFNIRAVSFPFKGVESIHLLVLLVLMNE